MNLNTVAIIQARMGSTRLAGKVLQDLCGEPMLARVVERTRRASSLNEVVVATSKLPADEAIVRLCADRGWTCFRGSEPDVLERYYQAALAYRAELIVRVTSDCPLTDPELIDRHVEKMLQRWCYADFVSNMLQQSFPLGLAVEVMPLDVLARMHRMSRTAELREHVTTLAYAEPEWFRTESVLHGTDLSHMRWTVDTAPDLEFVRRVFAHFGHDRFSWREVLTAVEQHPEWGDNNRTVASRAG
jgi:spore coat polysaccharide biosynthesis protein SpsF